jgi:large subunit ribosomal protein L28
LKYLLISAIIKHADLKEVNEMSRVCPITGKGPLSGNTRSHSLRTSRRRWNVNLHTYQIEINGKPYKVRMSARAYRTLNKSTKEN